MSRHLRPRFGQMHMLVDMIDPSDRNEMVMLAFGQLCFVSLILSAPSRWSTLPTVFLSDEIPSMCSLIFDVSCMMDLFIFEFASVRRSRSAGVMLSVAAP